MELQQFLADYQVTYSKNCVDENDVKSAEDAIGLQFGKELRDYLTKYGYLAYEYVELYGMNANQKLCSDLVRQTLYLHQYFPQTKDYVAVENQGEGDYYLVDSNDNVVRFDSNLKTIVSQDMSFFAYISKRFEEARRIITTT